MYPFGHMVSEMSSIVILGRLLGSGSAVAVLNDLDAVNRWRHDLLSASISGLASAVVGLCRGPEEFEKLPRVRRPSLISCGLTYSLTCCKELGEPVEKSTFTATCASYCAPF